MKAQPQYFVLRLLLALLFVGYVCQLPAAEKIAATNAPSQKETIQLSVFDASLPTGRDPFFPRSNRRPVNVPNANTNGNAKTDAADPTSLILQGISQSAKKPLITINNRTISLGEEAEITSTSGSRVLIRCEAVKVDSAIISINGGQPFELKMPKQY